MPETDRIYVGYLPTPRRARRALGFALPALLWVLLVPAFLWARAQHPAEPAVWNTSAALEWTGTLALEPYPMLVTGEGTLLIVESGKHGSQPRFAAHATGTPLTLRGYELALDNRRMIELLTTPDAVQPAPAGPPLPPQGPTREVILRGEIVDAKCHLGAMKPGRGPTHKACATLCVRGGIPAALVGFDALGDPGAWIVASPRGGPIEPRWLALIGEPVELRGTATTIAGTAVVTPTAIRPIGRP